MFATNAVEDNHATIEGLPRFLKVQVHAPDRLMPLARSFAYCYNVRR